MYEFERRNSPTNVALLDCGRGDGFFNVLWDLLKLAAPGPAALEQPVRVAWLQPVVGDFEPLTCAGVGARRDPVPLHADVAVGPT